MYMIKTDMEKIFQTKYFSLKPSIKALFNAVKICQVCTDTRALENKQKIKYSTYTKITFHTGIKHKVCPSSFST